MAQLCEWNPLQALQVDPFWGLQIGPLRLTLERLRATITK